MLLTKKATGKKNNLLNIYGITTTSNLHVHPSRNGPMNSKSRTKLLIHHLLYFVDSLIIDYNYFVMFNLLLKGMVLLSWWSWFVGLVDRLWLTWILFERFAYTSRTSVALFLHNRILFHH